MQTRSDDENSVCLSVRLCVRQTREFWQNKKISPDFKPYERSFSLVFWEKEWLVEGGGGEPFCLKFWVNRSPLEWNRRFWTDDHSYRLNRNT